MGDDVNIIVPPPGEEEQIEDTYERAGDELVALLTAQAERLGTALGRITELENRIIKLESREFADIGHTHEEFAAVEHGHEGYATTEHEHAGATKERKPDTPPEKQHPYFRKIGEF